MEINFLLLKVLLACNYRAYHFPVASSEFQVSKTPEVQESLWGSVSNVSRFVTMSALR